MLPTEGELDHIRALELQLHLSDVRGSSKKVDMLLAKDFLEFGSSGAAYTNLR